MCNLLGDDVSDMIPVHDLSRGSPRPSDYGTVVNIADSSPAAVRNATFVIFCRGMAILHVGTGT
jgi:hypothetical protein